MNGNKDFSKDHGSFKTPIFLLRLEGLTLFCLSLYLFHYSQGSWLLFAAIFFIPDLSLGGYLLGPRIGAMFYNILHTEIGPVLLAGIGLKYSDRFEHTHLGALRFGKWK